jgi:PAS domain S-box-containing protein
MSNTALRSYKYLEQARLRIRFKFQSKFPTAQTLSSNGSVHENTTDAPRIQADTPLEQARLRIRNRFLTKFPTSSTLASGKERKQPPMEASLAAANNDKSLSSLEEARHRIRTRFKLKFLPDFEAFPTTLDTAIPAMLHEKWGTKNAAVITSSVPPHRIVYVNSCWEQLCGFTSDQVTGETFASLGIEGSFTDPVMSDYLDQKLEKGEQVAVQLKNQTKDGKAFTNYLRVTPLTDPSTTKITHFLGVLQDEGHTQVGSAA